MTDSHYEEDLMEAQHSLIAISQNWHEHEEADPGGLPDIRHKGATLDELHELPKLLGMIEFTSPIEKIRRILEKSYWPDIDHPDDVFKVFDNPWRKVKDLENIPYPGDASGTIRWICTDIIPGNENPAWFGIDRRTRIQILQNCDRARRSGGSSTRCDVRIDGNPNDPSFEPLEHAHWELGFLNQWKDRVIAELEDGGESDKAIVGKLRKLAKNVNAGE